ncbi:MAG: DUF4142 domain-containing protein, partial [Saprospiraceae bacterium]
MLYSAMVLIASFIFISCGDKPEYVTTELSTAQVKPINLTKETDKQFLVRAVEMKYAQALLGKLAQQRTSSEEIRTLAKMLEDANREEKSALASLAIIKSIQVPSAPTQSAHAAYDSLNVATVEEFDFSYVRSAIQGYNDMIAHFENGTRTEMDPDIKAKALAMIPVMRTHLSKAMEVDAHIN